jgi:threonine/homoserine/homoserine lactone efflux protein
MPPVEVLLAFLAATAVFAFMPGPSTLYAAARTIAGGKRAGWLATVGIHAGGYLHVIAAALGLAVIFEATPFLYLGLKFVGAAYLIWLGVGMVLAKPSIKWDSGISRGGSPKRVFWDSAVVEILNPKTAIFYVAFLPQFTDPSAGAPIWFQSLALGAIVNVMFSSADAVCVLLSARVMEFAKSSASSVKWTQRLGGTILVGLGLRLAISQE